MPLSLDEIVTAYRSGVAAYPNGKGLAPRAAELWNAALATGDARIGVVALKDSARRQWEVDVRRDDRGRYLQFRPIGIDIERFRASADGHRRTEWLPIDGREWIAFALLAAGSHGGAGQLEDEELVLQVRRLLDRMVRDAQHQGLAFDEDED